MPLLFHKPKEIEPGSIKMSLLDVGQGLSVVIQTATHTLLYDTGPSFAHGSIADSVILPFFKKQSIKKLDVLVLSHADNDHAGGAKTILNSLPVDLIYKNIDEYAYITQRYENCNAGVSWQWDGVEFEFLNRLASQDGLKRNNTSCVLKVTSGSQSFLLPGDIEHLGENVLINDYAQNLAANILIAPHHGSRTSSGEDFITTVAPELILISSGYRNRYRHPSREVIQRYDKFGISHLNTSLVGEIEIYVNQRDGIYLVSNYRDKHKNYWTYL